MSGEGWSCFTQLPSGLIDPNLSSLTLNWLRPKPTHLGFKLSGRDIDEERYRRNVMVQRQALWALPILALAIGAGVMLDIALDLRFLADDRILFAAIWSSVAAVSAAALLIVLTGIAIIRFRQAQPRREAYYAAVAEFAHVDAWRGERCDPAFWNATRDEAAFEREAAELLAGYFGTGQVMLARSDNDYGVDVLLCAPQGRIVAQCKPWDRDVAAADVRALAGAKAFFAANRAVLVTLAGPSHDGEQAQDFSSALSVDLWDLDRIVAIAAQVRRAM
jgi:hypothetical protein